MMNIGKSTAPAAVGKARKSRLIARIITPLAVAPCLSLLSGAASADQFSPFHGAGVHTFNNQFGDKCQLTLRPVYDQGSTSGSYAIIGGIAIQDCSHRHSFEATVYEAYWSSPSSRWYLVTTARAMSGSETFTGSAPAGSLRLRTYAVASPMYWYTGSTVDEYDAKGNFIREVNQLSYVSRHKDPEIRGRA